MVEKKRNQCTKKNYAKIPKKLQFERIGANDKKQKEKGMMNFY